MIRSAIFLIVLTAGAFAQSGLVPRELLEYLVLTPTQVASIVNRQNAFFDYIDVEEEKQMALDQDIKRELAKPQPDSALVGAKVVEIELIDRGIEAKYFESVEAIRKDLTDAQKAKIKTLEDAYRLVPLIDQAQTAGVWDPQLEQGPFLIYSERGPARQAVSRAKKAAEARRKSSNQRESKD